MLFWCICFQLLLIIVVPFFFSSRRRHTRCYRDWSSDVCSSDLGSAPAPGSAAAPGSAPAPDLAAGPAGSPRSEERRVGKECRSRWSPYHEIKKEVGIRVGWFHCVEVTCRFLCIEL